MKTFLTFISGLMMLLCITNSSLVVNAQIKKSTLYLHKAKVLDSVFFQQLDSILNVNEMENHKFYGVNISNRNNHINKNMEILLFGFETLINEDSYIVDFKGRIYCIDTNLNNVLVIKDKPFSITYNLPIRPDMGDFISTYLILEYKNKKLKVKADSRYDKYLVE